MTGARPLPTNAEVGERFVLLAELLDIEGADRHRILAYRRAAESVLAAGESVARMAVEGRATDLPGIGATIQSKIVELVETGDIAALARLRERVPSALAEIARLEGVGGQRARAIRDTLGVEGLEDLRRAVAAGRLDEVAGLGPRTRAAIAAQLGVAPSTGAEDA
jgi:DNA polymerase (family 10)